MGQDNWAAASLDRNKGGIWVSKNEDLGEQFGREAFVGCEDGVVG